MSPFDWIIGAEVRHQGRIIRAQEQRRRDDELREREVRALEQIAEAAKEKTR